MNLILIFLSILVVSRHPPRFDPFAEAEVSSKCGTGIEWESPECLKSNHRVFEQSKAVVRILFQKQSGGRTGSYVCTAFKVKDQTNVRNALFLTAYHCNGQNMKISFDYQERTCNKKDYTSSKSKTCMLKPVLEHSNHNDWALYEVADNCDYANKAPQLTIGEDVGTVKDGIYLIGHPSGRPKIVSHEEAHDNGNHCELRSNSGSRIRYYCDTVGGMSGCPVFHAQTGYIIAVHTNGGCHGSKKSQNMGSSIHNFKKMLASKYQFTFGKMKNLPPISQSFSDETYCANSTGSQSDQISLDTCYKHCIYSLTCQNILYKNNQCFLNLQDDKHAPCNGWKYFTKNNDDPPGSNSTNSTHKPNFQPSTRTRGTHFPKTRVSVNPRVSMSPKIMSMCGTCKNTKNYTSVSQQCFMAVGGYCSTRPNATFCGKCSNIKSRRDITPKCFMAVALHLNSTCRKSFACSWPCKRCVTFSKRMQNNHCSACWSSRQLVGRSCVMKKTFNCRWPCKKCPPSSQRTQHNQCTACHSNRMLVGNSCIMKSTIAPKRPRKSTMPPRKIQSICDACKRTKNHTGVAQSCFMSVSHHCKMNRHAKFCGICAGVKSPSSVSATCYMAVGRYMISNCQLKQISYHHNDDGRGCCMANAVRKFHRRCHCSKTQASVCKKYCSADQTCKGYVHAAHGCQYTTTTSSCGCGRLFNKNNVGPIATSGSGQCGSGYYGCYVKKIPKIPSVCDACKKTKNHTSVSLACFGSVRFHCMLKRSKFCGKCAGIKSPSNVTPKCFMSVGRYIRSNCRYNPPKTRNTNPPRPRPTTPPRRNFHCRYPCRRCVSQSKRTSHTHCSTCYRRMQLKNGKCVRKKYYRCSWPCRRCVKSSQRTQHNHCSSCWRGRILNGTNCIKDPTYCSWRQAYDAQKNKCVTGISILLYARTAKNSSASTNKPVFIRFQVKGWWTKPKTFFRRTRAGSLKARFFRLATHPTNIEIRCSPGEKWGVQGMWFNRKIHITQSLQTSWISGAKQFTVPQTSDVSNEDESYVSNESEDFGSFDESVADSPHSVSEESELSSDL